MKRKKKVGIILGVLVVFLMLWFAFCGLQWSWGPFARLHALKTNSLAGNDESYALSQVQTLSESPLKGKTIVFLGSSVTYGASSKGVSFVDYLARRNGFTAVKEAVSGTTLTEDGSNSYISRLKNLDISQADLFVCQLSTNDASQKKPLGTIFPSRDASSFDTKTVAGAIEYIITYAEEKWGCPVVFYTNPSYDSERYEAMVSLLREIAKKREISVIDLWNDEDFNNIAPQQRKIYMADSIHPTQAGYLEWWTPVFETMLYEVIQNESH